MRLASSMRPAPTWRARRWSLAKSLRLRTSTPPSSHPPSAPSRVAWRDETTGNDSAASAGYALRPTIETLGAAAASSPDTAYSGRRAVAASTPTTRRATSQAARWRPDGARRPALGVVARALAGPGRPAAERDGRALGGRTGTAGALAVRVTRTGTGLSWIVRSTVRPARDCAGVDAPCEFNATSDAPQARAYAAMAGAGLSPCNTSQSTTRSGAANDAANAPSWPASSTSASRPAARATRASAGATTATNRSRPPAPRAAAHAGPSTADARADPSTQAMTSPNTGWTEMQAGPTTTTGPLVWRSAVRAASARRPSL